MHLSERLLADVKLQVVRVRVGVRVRVRARARVRARVRDGGRPKMRVDCSAPAGGARV